MQPLTPAGHGRAWATERVFQQTQGILGMSFFPSACRHVASCSKRLPWTNGKSGSGNSTGILSRWPQNNTRRPHSSSRCIRGLLR
jgi:hypothetical protein